MKFRRAPRCRGDNDHRPVYRFINRGFREEAFLRNNEEGRQIFCDETHTASCCSRTRLQRERLLPPRPDSTAPGQAPSLAKVGCLSPIRIRLAPPIGQRGGGGLNINSDNPERPMVEGILTYLGLDRQTRPKVPNARDVSRFALHPRRPSRAYRQGLPEIRLAAELESEITSQTRPLLLACERLDLYAPPRRPVSGLPPWSTHEKALA